MPVSGSFEGSRGPAAEPAFHLEAVPHVEAEESDVRRPRSELDRLHRIEAGIELCSSRLGREEQRRTQPDADDLLYSLPLATTRYRAHVCRGHPLAGRKRLSLRDIADRTVIVPEDGSLTQRLLHHKCAELGITLSRLVKTATFPLVKEAVLHGVGIGLLLDDSMSASSDLVAIDVAEMRETYTNCLLTPVDKRELRFARSFIDVAGEVLGV